jgi:hypothetical protein
MKKRNLGLAVSILCFLLVAVAVYEIMVLPGFIRHKETFSEEKLPSVNQSSAKQASTRRANEGNNIGTEQAH